jgi:hypothetical protein
MPEQSAANHARMVPLFHYVGGLGAIALLVWSLIVLVRAPDAHHAMDALTAVVLMIVFWYARTFPLTAQDRIIRLEERLRMARVLPADMQPRIEEFTRAHLIAMRFAPDDELPGLARQVLDGTLQDPKAIKAAIKQWRADHLRV